MTNSNKHFIYWILPSLVVLLCMLIYFFDIFGLSYIIAPEYNREFGVVENIQLIIIIAIIVIAIKSLLKAKVIWLKIAFVILLLGSVFIFLEEIDYGLHYYEYFMGKTAAELKAEVYNKDNIRNIHNSFDVTNQIKVFAYILLGFICLLPLLLRRVNFNNDWIDLLAPKHYLIYTLIAMALLNQLALYIEKTLKSEEINSLNSNVSEFEEVFIYYIVFLYVLEKSSLFLAREK